MSAETERKKLRRRILDDYRRNYSVPFWQALRDNESEKMNKLATRSYDFKRGVCMALPHSRMDQAMNDVDIEVREEMGVKS